MSDTKQEPVSGKLWLLKLIVTFMGLALIGSVIVLFIILFFRNSPTSGGTGAKTSTGSAAQIDSKNPCPGGNLTIPNQDLIDTIIKDGNILTLLTKTEDNSQEIIILDYCANRVINHIRLQHAAPQIGAGAASK